MKILKYISSSVFALLLLSSCEDVISVDVQDADERIVIEATLDADANEAVIRITKTNGLYITTELEDIKDAFISLASNNGENYTSGNLVDGAYYIKNILVNPGDEFTISVTVDNKDYVAKSKASHPIVIDTIEFIENDFPFGDMEPKFQVFATWQDDSVEENFYRLRPYRNDTLMTGIYSLTKDDFNIDGELQLGIPEFLDKGDKVRIHLLSVDENYYNYFYSLNSSAGGDGNSSPFNPKGNFDNGALGYFGVYYSDEGEIEL